jgi:hypothetical protein
LNKTSAKACDTNTFPGAYPKLQWSLFKPVVAVDTWLCRDASETVLQALVLLNPAKKPTLFLISTTGIAPAGAPRDVPFLLYPLYHWLLQDPHKDKAAMEAKVREHMELPEDERAVGTYAFVKPTLLLDGEGKGLEHVRQGTDEEPALGYTIQRKDVAAFVFERLVKPDEVPEGWKGKGLSLTY